MADIFDTVGATLSPTATPQPSGDIFDEVARQLTTPTPTPTPTAAAEPAPAELPLAERIKEGAKWWLYSPEAAQRVRTAIQSNVEPFIEHPVESVYKMVVPQKEDIEAIAALRKPETYEQNLEPGSQEWLNQVVGYGAAAVPGIPLLRGRGAFRLKPEIPLRPEAEVPPPADIAAAEAVPPPVTPAEAIATEAKPTVEPPVIPPEDVRYAGGEPPITPPITEPVSPVPEVEPRVTSTKNAVVDAEREARGLSPIMREVSRDAPELVAQAEARVAENPRYPEVLIDELANKTRTAIDPVDEAVLLTHKVELNNAKWKAAERAENLELPELEREMARREFDDLEERINVMDQATVRGGTLWSEQGRFRQQLMAEDYSLQAVERRLRMAEGEKELTPKESKRRLTVRTRLRTEAERLDAAKQRAQKRLDELKQRLVTDPLAVPPKRQRIIADRELMRLQADIQRVKGRIDQIVEVERRRNRTWLRKVVDTFVDAERSMKLSGVTTLGKIGAAGVTRLGTTVAEELVGGALRQVPGLRRIAQAAPTEGGLNLAAEIQAMKGLGRGLGQIKEILKGEKPTEEAFRTEKISARPQIKSWLDIPGRLHGAIKNPIRAAQYERALVQATKWAERHGLDITDPRVEQVMREHAIQSGRRAIFMQDNIVSENWNSLLGMLEGSKKFPMTGYTAARVGRFLLPIVKVPTNVAFETATHLGGLATGTAKLVQVMTRGLKTIKPEEADFIMRHYKKGLIGAGLFFTGYFNSKNFGGYYRPGEKPVSGEPRYGEMDVLGVRVPRWLLHAPAALVMQAGATFYKLTHGEKAHEKPEAVMETANEIVHEIPFMNELATIDKLLASDWEGRRERGWLARSTVVPQVIQNVATWTAPKDVEGYPVKRYPQGIVEQIMTGIPGLQERVSTVSPREAHRLHPPTMQQQMNAERKAQGLPKLQKKPKTLSQIIREQGGP
jgi:hypothetical protein